ncbi:bifunctional transcriptional activator/DNA repair enzyme AdaA [Gynuella sp.]|uniref:bifunctional transcriptional activator/DNA repair enzyme AdaA n=1 Tax=Gynuella sp. TaxID=2969146 RepID=UPI003D14B690
MNTHPLVTTDDPRWAQVVTRDSHADGQFVYSVRTTGIYCRPSCPSRRAKPENVTFYSSPEAAEQAGYRPCKRCRPDQWTTPQTTARLSFSIDQCSLGQVLVAKSTVGLRAILMGDTPETLVRELHDRFPNIQPTRADQTLEQTVAQVINLIEHPAAQCHLTLDIRGSSFQQQVWQALQDIPAGQTQSYTEVAARINAPKAARAVARACATNALAVVIPCHRVVRSNGSLSGYRWGIERKQALLAREQL